MFKGKRILVTGHLGMIGRELVELLEAQGAIVTGADLRTGQDLRNFGLCLKLCENQDYVFHLMGIKGSPKMTAERPLDFFVPMVQCNTNMIEAARQKGIKRFLYTSSIAVENPETDYYPAMAKLAGEAQLEGCKIQEPDGMKGVIVRPANVYGKYDDFDNPNAMVITSLIKKGFTSFSNLEVWGDGTQIRDFIHARDVARGMLKAIKELPIKPVNLCSGKGIKIREVAEIIAKEFGLKVKFNTTQPTGAKKRVMKINWDFKPEISIKEGLKEVINYVKDNGGRTCTQRL